MLGVTPGDSAGCDATGETEGNNQDGNQDLEHDALLLKRVEKVLFPIFWPHVAAIYRYGYIITYFRQFVKYLMLIYYPETISFSTLFCYTIMEIFSKKVPIFWKILDVNNLSPAN